MAVATIYNYFASKEEILLSIFRREFEQRMQIFRNPLGCNLPVLDKVKEILQDQFSQLSEQGDFPAFLIEERVNQNRDFALNSLACTRR